MLAELPYRAPLFEALVAHSRLGAAAFHVPGHKQRAVWADEEAAALLGPMLALDLTELSDTDDLHHPEGPLAEAQRLAADCYGAEETSFLVGGSTTGNLAMILGVCSPGDLLIVQRNVHKSIIHGLMLAGVKAVMLPPAVDPLSGLGTVPIAETVAQALERYKEAKAVVISTPNYYGMASPIDEIVKLAHERNVPILVDEAHGPHFGFHSRFPESALRSGADLVVQSAHKMLSAMTMGAMLHMQGDLVRRDAVRQALRMIQSSSPSFPIMASLDLARRQLHMQGGEAFSGALAAAERVLAVLPPTPFRALGCGRYASARIAYDPLKLALFDESGALSGSAMRDGLLGRNCVAEMADSRYVVMALGSGSMERDGAALAEALLDMAADGGRDDRPSSSAPVFAEAAPEQESIPAPIAFRRELPAAASMRLELSAGMTAGEWVIPYPPGIPVLYPGERITPDIIARLIEWRDAGVQIQGARDPALIHIEIWKD